MFGFGVKIEGGRMRRASATHRSICQDTWAPGDTGGRPLQPPEFKGCEVYHYYPLTLRCSTEALLVPVSKNRQS